MNRFQSIVLGMFALVLLSAVGCSGGSGGAESKLLGKWEVDIERLKEAAAAEMKKKQADSEDGGMAANMGTAFLENMLANMKIEMEFKSEGKCVSAVSMMGQDKTEEGTWEVVSESGDEVTLMVTMGDKEGNEGKLKFIDDDTIEMEAPGGQKDGMPPGMSKMVLKRVK